MEIRDAIRGVRAELIDVDRLRHAGNYAEAMALARETRAQAEAVGWPPLLASARLLEGRSMYEAGHTEEATVVLTNTYFEAEDAGSLEVAFRAARSLVVANNGLGRYREAEVWARHADALAQKKTDPGRLDEAEGHYLRMEVQRGLGELESAAEHGEQALAIREATLGAEHPITAAALRNLGTIYLALERDGEALAMFEQADGIWRDAVGVQHPHVGTLAGYQGLGLLAQGRIDEAIAHLEEGLEILGEVLPADHPNVAGAARNLGRALTVAERLDEAEPLLERSQAAFLERYGPRHPEYAMSLLDRMDLLRRRGDLEGALALGDRALAILRLSLEPSHPDLVDAVRRLAELHLQRGEAEDAVTLRREMVKVLETAHGGNERLLVTPLSELADAQRAAGLQDDAWQTQTRAVELAESTNDEAALVLPLSGLAELELEAGRDGEALELARRAARIATERDVGPRRSSRAHFVLARTLAATGASRVEARAAAERARKAYVTMHATDAVARIDAWLEAFENPAP